MDPGLTDRRLLVGRASRGLDAAVARALAAEGARVAGVSRTPEPGGLRASGAGRLDGLVVNSGGPPGGTFATVDEATWERAISGTLQTTIRLGREALPLLNDRARNDVRLALERVTT